MHAGDVTVNVGRLQIRILDGDVSWDAPVVLTKAQVVKQIQHELMLIRRRRPELELTLAPGASAPPNQTRRHRFLFRYWNSDVYLPRIETTVFLLCEHNDERGRTWELSTPAVTLYGVQISD